nr:PAAR-like protein [uncultured Prevotella sp.]
MVKIVTGGAIMCCTLGTGQTKLTVLSQSSRSVLGALVATEEDEIGLNNIPSFGVCKCSSPESSLSSPATRLTANYSERQYQWDKKADGAVILYVC